MVHTITMDRPKMDRMIEIGGKLKRLMAELEQIFPGREDLIAQMTYALACREHVLVTGTYGTGKSDLASTLFSCFEGANLFSIGLSKFMSESQICGPVDIKKLREESKVENNVHGTLIDCNFAELDEIFDANEPLLRTMLGILNERQFKRGLQMITSSLHTAVACTNGDPKEVANRYPGLTAVIDRFIFQSEVNYLTEPSDRIKMYTKYATGEKPTVRMSYDELAEFSEVVLSRNQVTDPYFYEVYERIISEYKKLCENNPDEKMPNLSDRRCCKLISIVEAHALLNGRFDVELDDILAIKWGLCMGFDKTRQETFVNLATPIIEQAKEALNQSVDEVQSALLTEYEAQIPEVPSGNDDTELVPSRRKLSEFRTKVDQVSPELQMTRDRKLALLNEVDQRIQAVDSLIQGGASA